MANREFEQYSKRKSRLRKFFLSPQKGWAGPEVEEVLRNKDVMEFNRRLIRGIYRVVKKELTNQEVEDRVNYGISVCKNHRASVTAPYLVGFLAALEDPFDYPLTGENPSPLTKHIPRVVFDVDGQQKISYRDNGKTKHLTLPISNFGFRFSRSGKMGGPLTFDKYNFLVCADGAELLASRGAEIKKGETEARYEEMKFPWDSVKAVLGVEKPETVVALAASGYRLEKTPAKPDQVAAVYEKAKRPPVQQALPGFACTDDPHFKPR